MDPILQFFDTIKQSIEGRSFVKLTLSKPYPRTADLRNIYIRQVVIKGQDKLSFTYHHTTKDTVKNHTVEEAESLLRAWLGQDFLTATLMTTKADWSLQFNKKRKARLQQQKASVRQAPSLEHNKQKQYLIEENRPFLEALKLASNGRVLKAHQDKYRQINKYVEIMATLLEQADLPKESKIVDMGSGKGYLTFALYEFMQEQLGMKPNITGIELREALTSFCQQQAKALNWERLHFEAKDINAYANAEIDVLIALHACDIATDLAIAKGILANAALIVTAPCCHKQVRKATNPPEALKGILKHGILAERQAEIATDAIRALLLEAHGYKTKVFEFISSEHTAKNVMITAVRQKAPVNKAAYLEQIASIKSTFGIDTHYLETLLQKA
jgi:2-polyprenyl-3-methyl-5-hydroxy-6-metoxy-1,4-benzoquinol methylase